MSPEEFKELTDQLADRLLVNVEDLPGLLGISRATLFCYRTGKRKVSRNSQLKIQKALNASSTDHCSLGTSHSTPKGVDETLHIPLTPETEAVLIITIRTTGLGAIDPATHAKPTLSDLDLITRHLSARNYSLTSTLP